MSRVANAISETTPKPHDKADTRNPRLVRNEMDDANPSRGSHPCFRGLPRVPVHVKHVVFAGVRVTESHPGPLDFFLLTVLLKADPGESTRSKVCTKMRGDGVGSNKGARHG